MWLFDNLIKTSSCQLKIWSIKNNLSNRCFWAGVFLLLLCGCGFHFAGKPIDSSQVPDLNIRSSLPSLWQQRLYRFLKIREVNNYPSSELSLWIEDFSESKRPVSLNSRAKVAEYSLEFSFKIRLTDKNNTALMEPKKLTAGRIYRFNEQQVPGKQAEEDFLKQAMIEDLFDQMLRYVDAALKNQPTKAQPIEAQPITNQINSAISPTSSLSDLR